ncbi:hypothetical protein NTGBS_250001 [Candidatus Nitrotoga sp. BS]|nr:hypothetical protein NTGBS_250001 [Candidatus Nitrotoga sp. BS]
MLVDVDYFKRINDGYGHQEGDKVLICLSSLLSKAFRRTDSVGRWGGEEFLVVCPELDQQTALKLAELFREKIEQYDFGVAGKVTVSIGLAIYEKGGTMDRLIMRVDNALYQAKDGGRNRVVMSD